jgi:lambda family phage tail tape measure protein
MATNTLNIRVRADGTRVVTKGVKGIGESANLASRQVFLLRRAVTTLFAAAGIRAAFRAIETFTELNNKLKTVTKTTNELVDVRKKLLSIANKSRSSLSATVQLYARTTRAVKTLGLSEAQRLKFTSLLTKETVIGGATAIEAENAIRQLTQGMGAAGLKGEELRSVLEQLPTVAERIADFLGVTTGELRKLGEEGELTGEVVVAAMLAAEDSIEKAFGKTTPTVSQSFGVLKNNLVEFFGELDQGAGVSAKLSEIILKISQNLDAVIGSLTALAGLAAFNFLISQAGTFAATIATGITRLTAMKAAINGLMVAQTVSGGQSAVSAFLAGNAASSRAAEAASMARVSEFLRTGGGKVASTTAQIFKFSGAILGASVVFGRLSESIAEANKEGLGFFDTMVKILNDLDFGVLDTAEAGFESLFNTLSDGVNIKWGIGDDRRAGNDGMSSFPGLERMMGGNTKKLEEALDQLPAFDFDKKLLNPERLVEVNQEIARLTKGLNALNEAYVKGVGGEEAPSFRAEELEKFQASLKKLNEEKDRLTGGAKAATEAILAENEAFNKFGGDMEAVGMIVKGAAEDQVRAFLAAKEAQEKLTAAKSAAEAAQRDSARAQERVTDAIQGTINALKEELRLFGLVGRARERAQFQALSPGSDQLAEFDRLSNQLGQKEVSAQTQAEINELTQKIQRFGEAAKRLQEIAKTAPAEKQKEIADKLTEGRAALEESARLLAQKIALEVGGAATSMVEEARTVLVAGGTTIGGQVGTAFVAAFKAAIGGAIPGLSALVTPGGQLPTSPGATTPGGTATNERADQIERINTQLQSTKSSGDSATKSVEEMIRSYDNFGFAAESATSRAGSAMKNFGDNTSSIGQELQSTFSSIFGSLEDALVGFVTTGKLDFKSLINSIIADLARMVIRMLIIKPLMGFFGGFFGGIFGFSGGGSVGGAFGLPGFDGGGFVNDNPATPQRFATGGRVHGQGTGVSDSVNALLSRDEFVVNAAASRPNMAGLEYLNQTGRMPGGGSVTSVSYSPMVNVTVEGNSANAAGDGARIAKDMEQQMRAQFNEFVSQEQRPGGAFSKTNDDVL